MQKSAEIFAGCGAWSRSHAVAHPRRRTRGLSQDLVVAVVSKNYVFLTRTKEQLPVEQKNRARHQFCVG